ncbi:MAG: apolipoprotein N-acyltransferase [Bacteroidota bacterium]|nr:apolipoprotein N-acyltransferase [Bacteroidota bacterium]
MMHLNKYTKIGMAISSGLLLSIAYTQWHMGWIILIGFVPLLILEEYAQQQKTCSGHSLFGYAFLAFMVWNIISTYWIYYATAAGSIFALGLNALFMTVLFVLYHKIKIRLNRNEAYIALVVLWVAFEFFYMKVKLSWPWLNLGNSFANNVQWIQWYEFTGTLGGTIWVLISNLLIFEIFRRRFMLAKPEKSPVRKHIISLAIILIVPLTLSLIRYHNYEEQGKDQEVVVLQPNIDPYKQKFSGSVMEQLQNMLHLTDSVISKNTDYVVFPETALPLYIDEDSIPFENDGHIKILRQFNQEYPDTKFIVGLTSRKFYNNKKDVSPTAHKYQDFWFDEFNTAMQIDTSGVQQFYHKSKLVPGVESIPYVDNWKWLNKFIINLGGPRNSLGYDTHPSTFISPDDSVQVAAIICYESVYGEYVSSFVRLGANLIFIMTNDGWWRDTPGYKQHAAYARLRAIETRRAVARSANTGISSIINQRGDIVDYRGWWTETVIKGTVKTNDKMTFYARFGDYPGRISAFLAALILLHWISNLLMRRKNR